MRLRPKTPSISGNLVKLAINIHIWARIYTFGHEYTHLDRNISEMCSLEA